MEMPEQARRWQERIDKTFPDGILLTADDESGGRTESFLAPRPEVVSMRGMDPVVFIEVPSHHRSFSGVVTGWEQVQDRPCTVVQVTMDTGSSGDRDKVSRWSGNVSPAAAAAMREWRTASLLASEQGDIYQGRSLEAGQ